jgi:hypothetical protein
MNNVKKIFMRSRAFIFFSSNRQQGFYFDSSFRHSKILRGLLRSMCGFCCRLGWLIPLSSVDREAVFMHVAARRTQSAESPNR